MKNLGRINESRKKSRLQVFLIIGAALLHFVLFVPALQGIFKVTIFGAQLVTIYGLAIPLRVNQGWKMLKNDYSLKLNRQA